MKKENHRINYKTGGRHTQVDYLMYRRKKLKEIGDCKVVVGESVASQHRMVVCKLSLKIVRKNKREVVESRVKWWKLKKVTHQEDFRREVLSALKDTNEPLTD